MELFVLLLSLTVFYLYSRLRNCEKALKQLKNAYNGTREFDKNSLPSQASPGNTPITNQVPVVVLETHKEPPPLKVAVQPAPKIVKQKTVIKPFKIPNVVKENWIGVFGSVALVIGAVFFGLTAEIMQHPAVRVGILMVISVLFLGVSQKLKKQSDWTLLAGWLKSIAGTVILFATLGAGAIEGLKFIDTSLYALSFLSLGIVINIILALTSVSQGVASLHVILSIIAFCIIPQIFILLPIGAVVSGIGLVLAYRTKWDLHLLLVVIAFGIQNTIWTLLLDSQLLPWMHYSASGCSVMVSLIAACAHYRKKYQSPKLEILPCIAHITNWGLLAWNICLHAQFSKWTPLILGAVAMAGFVLTKVAKRKEISWLYYTDTLLSQLIAISAIASMINLSINPMNVSLIILVEILLFNLVCQLQKEDLLLRAGYFFQSINYFITAYFTFEELSKTPSSNQFPIYLLMGGITFLSWSYYLIGSLKNFVVDDLRFVLFEQKRQKDPLSIMSLFGTLFFLAVYFFGFNSLVVQVATLSVAVLVALWRKLKEDFSCNVIFLLTLASVHVMNWFYLGVLLQKTSIHPIISRVDLLGLCFLDALLIFGNFLQLKLWKKNFHQLVCYALGIQTGLLTYAFTKEISILIPGIAFLGFSLLVLEISRVVPMLFGYSDDVNLKIKEGLTHIGLAFLMAFISRFVMVHLQIDPIWYGISLRWITEVLGLLAIFYWIAFYPREHAFSKLTQFFRHRLVEICLGFITLCVFAEVPEIWRPLIWAIMAIGLLSGNLSYKWPPRLLVYSWMYLMASIVHVAFVTSTLTMPSLFLIEQHNIPAFMTIALHLCLAYIALRSTGNLRKSLDPSSKDKITRLIPILYDQPSLTVLLPIFLGIALLFAFNFEKTILTLLWIGLTCLYMVIGLLIKSKKSIQIAMAAIALCSIRLIVFDLVQSNVAIRALVFIGAGILMLGVSVLYKKYKHRIEAHELV